MKKLYTLGLTLFSILLFAQISISPNPWNINSGTITITYGPDFSIWDPQGEPVIYMYSGVETDGTAGTWDYHDDWADTNTMTPLTLDASTGVYTGSIDVTQHLYIEEANQSNYAALPAGLQVTEFYFLFRNPAGDSQSVDLLGSDYGFQVSTLGSEDVQQNALSQCKVVNDVLYPNNSDFKSIQIFDRYGRIIKTLSIQNQNSIDLNLTQGVYFLVSDQGDHLKILVK